MKSCQVHESTDCLLMTTWTNNLHGVPTDLAVEIVNHGTF